MTGKQVNKSKHLDKVFTVIKGVNNSKHTYSICVYLFTL
jgi:hypothetical protein